MGSNPRPALVRITARAMFLSDADHLKSIFTPSDTTGMFLSRKPISSIPATQQRGCERGKIILQDCLSHSYRARMRSPVAYGTYSAPVGHLRLAEGLRSLSYSTDKSSLDQFQTFSTKSHGTCQFLYSKHAI